MFPGWMWSVPELKEHSTHYFTWVVVILFQTWFGSPFFYAHLSSLGLVKFCKRSALRGFLFLTFHLLPECFPPLPTLCFFAAAPPFQRFALFLCFHLRRKEIFVYFYHLFQRIFCIMLAHCQTKFIHHRPNRVIAGVPQLPLQFGYGNFFLVDVN